MFDRILVPFDGSPESEKIRYWVAGLAAEMKSVVNLLAVVDPTRLKRAGEATTEELIEEESEYAHQYLRKQVDWFQERDVTVAPYVVSGDPATEIISQASELDVKLIAMTTHRRSALMRGLLGSVADRVLHATGVPILLARPGEVVGFENGEGLPRTVIVPLDGSNFAEAAVPFAEAIAKHTSGRVLYISGDPPNASYAMFTMSDPAMVLEEPDQAGHEKITDYLERVAKRSAVRGVDADHIRIHRTAADAITEVTAESSDRLVVMTSHGSSGAKRWLLGSVADKVIRMSEHPVIVIPPEHQQITYRGGAARRP